MDVACLVLFMFIQQVFRGRSRFVQSIFVSLGGKQYAKPFGLGAPDFLGIDRVRLPGALANRGHSLNAFRELACRLASLSK